MPQHVWTLGVCKKERVVNTKGLISKSAKFLSQILVLTSMANSMNLDALKCCPIDWQVLLKLTQSQRCVAFFLMEEELWTWKGYGMLVIMSPSHLIVFYCNMRYSLLSNTFNKFLPLLFFIQHPECCSCSYFRKKGLTLMFLLWCAFQWKCASYVDREKHRCRLKHVY